MKNNKGFTLIELLIVIAIIAALSALAFVALNPIARFQDSRNAQRWNDVNTYAKAIRLYQIDHSGEHISTISNLTAGEYYQIGVGDGCLTTCSNPTVVLQDTCLDPEELVDGGYLSEVFFDPNASGADTDETRYYVSKSDNDIITVGACSEELGSNAAVPEIMVTR